MSDTDLLDRYADRAGLLEGALKNIIDMAEAGSSPGEIFRYARDVLARAEPAQDKPAAPRYIVGPDGVPYGPFPPAQAGR